MLAVGAHTFMHLNRQLARRHEDQATRLALSERGAGGQQLQDRQGKTGGLAGARLGGGHQVAAGQHHGNSLGLNRRGRVVTFFGNGTQYIGRQAEVGKVHKYSWNRPTVPMAWVRTSLDRNVLGEGETRKENPNATRD